MSKLDGDRATRACRPPSSTCACLERGARRSRGDPEGVCRGGVPGVFRRGHRPADLQPGSRTAPRDGLLERDQSGDECHTCEAHDIVTGVIGDHGTDRPASNSTQKIVLSKGTFEVDTTKSTRALGSSPTPRDALRAAHRPARRGASRRKRQRQIADPDQLSRPTAIALPDLAGLRARTPARSPWDRACHRPDRPDHRRDPGWVLLLLRSVEERYLTAASPRPIRRTAPEPRCSSPSSCSRPPAPLKRAAYASSILIALPPAPLSAIHEPAAVGAE